MGDPLALVVTQLGYTDTTMVEKCYGHLSPSALADSIRKLAPMLKISKPKGNVTSDGKEGSLTEPPQVGKPRLHESWAMPAGPIAGLPQGFCLLKSFMP